LFSRNQAITAMVLAERVAAGYGDDATVAALESALFAKALWPFVVGTLAGGVAVGFIFRGGLSELNRLAQPQHRAAVVSTFFVAAYVGLGLPAVLTGLISLPLGPVDASAWVSGLAAAAVALAYLVVRRVAPSSATRPCAAS
jgi:predicted MFS family arabinose efflux permease